MKKLLVISATMIVLTVTLENLVNGPVPRLPDG
jgi:hypothetical protein